TGGLPRQCAHWLAMTAFFTNTDLANTAITAADRQEPKNLYIRHKYIDMYLTNPTYGIIMDIV
ncbi:MAG: hypothetical protein ACI4PL_00045, partial [Faecousia sp.]